MLLSGKQGGPIAEALASAGKPEDSAIGGCSLFVSQLGKGRILIPDTMPMAI
jgi:hypothetical protein